ncbi:hypothetical protein QJS04_geneDACA018740 [Acorus gramineus]|uniref:Uncharacterized protein n=1 Tax=Acorus gramineus TaxID=55184 RepID=A0AAV9AAY8_ACOGR|nr:hypothetical protein QJS04_geneDACA018740 [Acorus gramineus]
MGSPNGEARASYWIDACEEGMADFDHLFDDPTAPQKDRTTAAMIEEDIVEASFLTEIDQILESIGGCDGGVGGGGSGSDGALEAEAPPARPLPPLPPPPLEVSECVPAAVEAPGLKRCSSARDDRERYSKRAKPDRTDERWYGRRQEERGGDRRDGRDWSRKKDHRDGGRDRDWRERERRGYWERDRSGKLAFRVGQWEADPEREPKRARREDDVPAALPDQGRAHERKEKPVEEQARKYQLDVLQQAKRKNTIAFLETGAGKTLIAVLLIKSVCEDMIRENKRMLAIFLVPKVPLVYQQAEVIREQTGYRVGHYCGEMGQDFWDARRWQREFESKQKEKRPIVFGMTASPVNLKGVSNQEDCAIKIRNLESKLDSTVYTIKDRRELEKHVPMPLEIVVEYDKASSLWSLHEQIKQIEVAVEEAALSSSRRSKWKFMGARDAGSKEELRLVYGVSERTESDGAANLIQKLRAINYALGELGQWCAYKVAQSFLMALQNDERANYQVDVMFQESYLKKVVALLQCQLSEGAASDKDVVHETSKSNGVQNSDDIEEGELPDTHVVSGGEHVDVIIGAAVADGKVTPKVQALVKILLQYQQTEDFRAIIFVERVVAALVLPKVLLELPSLNFIKCASLIGHNNNQEMRTCQMQDTISKFRDGRVTLLVATSVAEEGLDIRQCNVVIRFDLAKTVESTGAIVSLNSAVGLVHFYCSQLPSDRYSILRPEFIMERHEKPGGSTEYSCKLQLPCNAPFEKLEVCLAACKKLHEMGAFTDMLLPDKGSGEEREKNDQSDEGEPLPGTARHREFYPEGVAESLRGDWILCGRDGCTNFKTVRLYMYAVQCVNMGTTKDVFLTQVSDFAVLFGSELDAEVLSMSMDLFVARTMLTKASLVYRGPVDIKEDQLISLKTFHVRLMSIVLDVDVDPLNTPWDPAKAYLFVPVTCCEGETEENLDKTYYVFLPPELCFVHPLPGSLVRGAQRLPSIMRRVESMLLAIQLKDMINYPVPASKILEALTAASCQETFCYERAELLGDAYLKWVVSKFLFLKYPQKHEGQLTRMRQQMVSNMVLYQYALNKGLQSYIQADRFAPSRWAAPGVLPVFDEETKEPESSKVESGVQENLFDDDGLDDAHEDGEIESDPSCYRVLSSKTLADVVEALIGVYYVDGGKVAANHLMNWIGIHVNFDSQDDMEYENKSSSNIPDSILRSVDFEKLESALQLNFRDRGLLVEAITHASRPSSGVSCYQRLEFLGDAVLDHLITGHLFFTYTDLPPGRLTDLRAAAVNNENFARVAVKHKLHVHLRHGSSALEAQIREFVKDVQDELTKPGFNSFGLGDCRAPKVLGDIVESIAGAIFLDNARDTAVVWKVFQPLLHPMVTPETLPMHPVRELQERCQQQAEGLEYRATRIGNLATVEVFIDGVQIGVAQNPQKKMAQKLAARNALVVLKEKETISKQEGENEGKNSVQVFTRQTLNDICLRRQWPMPQYRCINEGGPPHAKRFVYSVRVNTTDRGWTDECIGQPMPSVKKAKDSAAVLLLELLERSYPSTNK